MDTDLLQLISNDILIDNSSLFLNKVGLERRELLFRQLKRRELSDRFRCVLRGVLNLGSFTDIDSRENHRLSLGEIA